MLTFGSLFAGIGGFDLGFEQAGMRCLWRSEINAKCNALMDERMPGIPNLGDVRNVTKETVQPVDVICGGFPCQDLSVAGKRKGLAGSRSGLWFEFHRVLAELRPQWAVIENVPGLLSSNGGRDFAVILRGLAQIGYLSAWRVLDLQYYGMAQRRRRVFIVASLGDGRAAEVLFERESLSWDSAPSRETGTGVADPVATSPYADNEAQHRKLVVNALSHSGVGTCGADDNQAQAGHLICSDVSRALTACKTATGRLDPNEQEFVVAYSINTVDDSRQDRPHGGMYVREIDTALTPSSKGQTVVMEIHGGSKRKDRPSGGFYVREMPTTKPLDTGGLNPNCAQGGVVAIQHSIIGRKPEAGAQGKGWRDDGATWTLDSRADADAVAGNFGVRRLTPTECERLQGFEDGHTDNGQSDSARYRQLGNAVGVRHARWIGEGIVKANSEP